MADLGKIIYKRYRDGVPVDEEEKALCEQIDEQYGAGRQIQRARWTVSKETDSVRPAAIRLGRNDAFCSMMRGSLPCSGTRRRGWRYCRRNG